jgi:hypothetical protein
MMMTDDELAAAGEMAVINLEQKWEHACDIAFTSIGQSDHAQNVAYRDALAEQLRQARTAMKALDG